MNNNNNKAFMKNLMILGLSAMMLASCGTTQNKQDNLNNTVSNLKVSKDVSNMDNEYLILSDAQQSIVDRGNQFALNLSVLRQAWTPR